MPDPNINFGAVDQWPAARVGEPYSFQIPIDLNGHTVLSIASDPPSPNWLAVHMVAGPDRIHLTGIPPLAGEQDIHIRIKTDLAPLGIILNDPSSGPAMLIRTANQHPITDEELYAGFKEFVLMPGQTLGVDFDGLADPDMAFTNTDPAESVKLLVNVSGRRVGVPPHISSVVPIGDVILGDQFNYAMTVDAGGPVTWDLVSYPAGMTINHLSGAVRWIPTQAGSFVALARASNAAGYDEQQIDIGVVVELPEFNPDPANIGPFSVPLYGWVHNFVLDAGSPPVTFSIIEDTDWDDYVAAGGAASITANGTLTITMGNGGTYHMKIRASNAAGDVDIVIEFTMI